MVQIDRHNCEAFFLDYHEGNLSPVQAGETLLFLEENPDMKGAFEEYEHFFLAQEQISFPGKTEMKKKYTAEGIESLLSSEITFDNCEQFYIAFIEGQLSEGKITKLNFFLVNNPEQKREFELFQRTKLTKEEIVFESKEALKKSFITKENCEEYFIRSVEKDLNRVEEEQLKIFVKKNPEYKIEFELFAKTILSPETIYFKNKSSLKKKERKPVFVSIFTQRATYYAAAAAIFLLVGLFFIFKNNGDTNKQEFALKTTPLIKKENAIVPEKKESSQITILENKIQNDEQSNNRTIKQSNVKIKKPSTINHRPSTINEKKLLLPIILEDNENLIAEKEKEKPKMMEQEVIAEKNQEQRKVGVINSNQEIASVSSVKSEEAYQTVESFVRKKVRQILGIKKATECETEDKITVWDVAMAAKNGVQNLIGTKVLDVNKVCDGSGDKVEYIFAAGNFQISKSASGKKEQ